jgi:hypothetical protein
MSPLPEEVLQGREVGQPGSHVWKVADFGIEIFAKTVAFEVR